MSINIDQRIRGLGGEERGRSALKYDTITQRNESRVYLRNLNSLGFEKASFARFIQVQLDIQQ